MISQVHYPQHRGEELLLHQYQIRDLQGYPHLRQKMVIPRGQFVAVQLLDHLSRTTTLLALSLIITELRCTTLAQLQSLRPGHQLQAAAQLQEDPPRLQPLRDPL